MAIRHICDGCEKPIDGEAEHIGHALKRDYCKACAKTAHKFQQVMDELHQEVADKWNEGIRDLRERYLTTLKALPDYAPPETGE